MLRYNLLLVYRHFNRFKGSFLINLIGLSTGLACAILIYLWVSDELSMDKFHENRGQIFQVMKHMVQGDDIITDQYMPGYLAEAMAEEMPEVVHAASVRENLANVILSVEEKNVKADGRYVSKDFFKIFTYPIVQGDRDQAWTDRNTILISETLSMKLFQTTENVIGKTVTLQHDQQFFVSGVFEDIPRNSSEQFDFALSFEELAADNEWVLEWRSGAATTFVMLREGTNIEAFNQKISPFLKDKTNNEHESRTPFLKPYNERYLYGSYDNGVQAGGRIEYVRLFSIIAIFILVIACINFMNLSTAKASRRLKEVGVKKAIGAGRKALIYQYLGESLLMAFLSLILAFLLLSLLLPQFNLITAKQLTLTFDTNLMFAILGITFITGIIAGSYPAFYLSDFDPVTILKGKLNSSFGEIWIRKGLVVFQFMISVILIVSVMVVYKQLEYIQSKNLGYNRDNIILFDREGRTEEEHIEAFLSELKKIPGVVNASGIGSDLTGANWSVYGFNWEGKDPNDNTVFENVPVDYDLMGMLRMEMALGRKFSRDFSSDSSKIILNEAAIEHMGLKDPIGKFFNFWGQDMEIIGVVKDFHFESLYENIRPLIFRIWPERINRFMVKIEAGKGKETIARLQEWYQIYNDGFTFDYKFLDNEYQAQYVAEQRVSTLSKYFAGLAIIISCLGLFGLASFTAERRFKEIGIRKILGSSEFDIINLLSGDFIKMVLIAIILALPVSYIIAKQWLNNFAYTINLSWWFFIVAGLIGLLVAWLTVSLHTFKASRINPVECLRNE